MSRKGLLKGIAVPLCVLFVICIIPNAYGSGFAIFTQGATALGQANAVIANSDSPSAIFFNPALINKLDGTQIEAGTTVLLPSNEFRSDLSGKTFKTEEDVFFPSTVFITHKFNDKVSAGLGVFNSFGLGIDWGDDWEGRYIATNSELQTFNINPVVSYQIMPNIAFAAGVNYVLLDTTLEKQINLSPYGLSDAGQQFDGDGDGIGYNLGFIYDINEDISIGTSYRSKIEVDIDGDADFDLPNGTPSLISTLFQNTGGNADLTLPQQAHVGITYRGIDRLTLETGLRWEGWSSFDELKINLDQPVAGSKTSVTEKDWKDTYSVNLGAKYQINKTFALLAGYLYSGNPVPDKTFDPIVPDANTHLITLGTNIKFKQFRIDIAYGYQRLEGRSKNNSLDDNPSDSLVNSATSASGKYDSDLHLIGISLVYNF
ncbi:OmpP1/FadL family transporter [uncultured Candidatus Kuenenia sp.]|uniref:OmpP1/FadL family transporter n=1 Tax=Candidatus Kuenenia sp. TaxID=2499824 RepID=UPI00031296A4|nr:OmpP1/FadL family transporter [uncultured Candidatus Kuenenia sp.]MBE7546130.1 transporter [Planctomycetia bacterium]TVM01334.1 MAG: aromatic hydrocarbon degradation protein [Candidatus Kuenenia stuttgartiensis]